MIKKTIHGATSASFSGKLSLSTQTGILIVILLILAVLKFFLNKYITHYSVDGGFYFDVARHVHDGLGLKSRISLYHKGYTYFPHPTSIYPLWPLLLGYTSKITSLPFMAIWLPTFLYFLSLVLAYLWANKIWNEKLFANLPNLNAGHFLVLFLGLNSSYFVHTSLPYTEGLAFALLFAFLLRAHSLLKKPGLLSGAEIGIWLGLLLLTRSQWLIVVIAMAIVYLLAIYGRQTRYRYLGMALGSATLLVLVMLPFWFYVASFSEDSRWTNFFHFSARANSLLSVPSFSIDHSGFFDVLMDRLSGIPVAFGYLTPHGYSSIFHEYIYLIPVALIVLLTSFRYLTIRSIKRSERVVEQNDRLQWYLPVLIALGALWVIHLLHNEYISEWYFNRRHAIPVVLPVFLSFLYITRRKTRMLNLIVFTLLFTGTSFGVVRNMNIAKAWQHETSLEVERRELAEWLEAERERAGREVITVAISDNEGQQLVWRTRKINYHWIYYGATKFSDFQTLFGELGCDYLVILKIRDSVDYPLPELLEAVPVNFEYFDIYRVNQSF